MKTLCIYTEKYPEAMRRFFPADGDSVLAYGSMNGADYIYASNRQSTRVRLQGMMEYILLNDNPVLVDSEKAFGSVAELAFQPTRGIMKLKLEEFLRESDAISIEGYISFRLSEYSGRINAILYSIVKKNLYKT